MIRKKLAWLFDKKKQEDGPRQLTPTKFVWLTKIKRALGRLAR